MIIVQGGVDAHMAMFGLNVIVPNKIGVIMGTSLYIFVLLKKKKSIKEYGVHMMEQLLTSYGSWKVRTNFCCFCT